MKELSQIDNAELEYFSFGTGKHTLVILPGLGTRSILFAQMMITAAYKTFSTDFTIYVFDRRKNIPSPYTVREMARDTANVMRHLGLRNADVFGTSLGGMVAQYLAIDHPDLVHSLILASTTSHANERILTISERWASAADCGDLASLTEQFTKLLYSASTVEKFGSMLAHMNDGLTEQDLRRFSVQARAIQTFDAYGELECITCPVLVIGVKDDKVLTGEASEEIAAKLGCELYMYPNTYGHCVFDEAPDYKDRIMHFFKSNQSIE